MRKILLSTIASLTLATAPANAQNVEQAKQLLDVWLAAQVDYNDWPSLSVAFVHGQDLVYANAFGFANREDKVEATPDTLYSICSISKLFTSISVMQQRDAGKLSLRDPIAKHLDWYNIKQQYPLSDDVTLEAILSHSSGLPREVDTPYWSGSEGFPFPTLERAKKITQDQKTLYRAWEHYQYSNLALSLAGQVVARVSGQDYHAYVRKNLLDPLGLHNTYSEMPKDKHGKELAVGYGASPRKGERAVIPYFNANAIGPAAGYASTVNDLAKFAMWQLKLRKGEGDNVLDQNTLREMQRPHSVIMGWRGAFGIGFSLRNLKGKTLIGHGGSCPGYRSQLYIDPDKGIGAVAMINAGGVNPGQVVERLLTILGSAVEKSDKGDKDAKKDTAKVTLSDYQGIYDGQPWSDESYMMAWGDTLVSFSLSSNDPVKSMTKFKHIDGDTFARLRSDDSEAETITFLRDKDGKVSGRKSHSNVSPKKP